MHLMLVTSALGSTKSTNNENQKMKCNKTEERWKLYARSLRNDCIMTFHMAKGHTVCEREIEMAANVKRK